MTGTRYDDQNGDGQSYLDESTGGTRPIAGGSAGPRAVPSVERNGLTLYRCIRKGADITDYTEWRVGSYVNVDEVQIPGAAYDIGAPVEVGFANSITWFINYVPPLVDDEEGPTPFVLSCIMEVSFDGSRYIPYTMVDAGFAQLNLNGNASQPEPVGVGTLYATRSVYAVEMRSPNMLAGDVPAAPYDITRRLDQPEFDLDATAPPNPPESAPQVYPIGFHLTFDVAPFTDVRLRWRQIEVDAAGTFVANGPVDTDDPRDPATNGFVTIHYALTVGSCGAIPQAAVRNPAPPE